MTRSQLRQNVRNNLSDAGITYYQDNEINISLQDAYNDIAAKCQCIVNNTTLFWLQQVVYYDFLTGNNALNVPVSDYLGVIAIFNNATNLWLRDDVSIRDLDRIRIDWELWQGQSQFWAPHSLKYTAIAPRLQTISGQPPIQNQNNNNNWNTPQWNDPSAQPGGGNIQVVSGPSFILWYWGKAPIWTDEDDKVTEPLVASDMQTLFEYYTTADLLESAEEPTKAQIWWAKYFQNRTSYKERCRDNARADLLQRI